MHWQKFDALAEQSTRVVLVGRIRSLRTMGKLVFAHVDDGTSRIQRILVASNDVGEASFSFFVENFDIGDFVEAAGTLFLTKTQEKDS